MKKIVLISSFCDTDEKINILKTNIDTIKELGMDVMLNSPIPLPLKITSKCDYFFLTKENPVLKWPQKAVYVWNESEINGKHIIKNKCLPDYGWANIYQVKKLSEFALTYDYDRFYHIIYDLIIDDVVLDGFKSDRTSSFYHFHEHNVSLHLMIFDREHLIKFISQLTLEKYLEIGGIAEQWLDALLKLKPFDFEIENAFVDDQILFNGNGDLHNYSKNKDIKFFIIKDAINLTTVKLFFYEIEDSYITIRINNDNRNYKVTNGDIIDLGFNCDNVLNTTIENNGYSQNITKDIKEIIHNTIKIDE